MLRILGPQWLGGGELTHRGSLLGPQEPSWEHWLCVREVLASRS